MPSSAILRTLGHEAPAWSLRDSPGRFTWFGGLGLDDSPEELVTMGRNAGAYALKHFFLERQAELVSGIYAELLRRTHG
jgi:hypothetical protein